MLRIQGGNIKSLLPANNLAVIARVATWTTRAPVAEDGEWTIPAVTSRASACDAGHGTSNEQYGCRCSRNHHVSTADAAGCK